MSLQEVQAQIEAERQKIAVTPQGPALQTPEAALRFLDRVGLLPKGIQASASNAEAVLDYIASRGGLSIYEVDQALANTTLSSFGKMVTKAQLGKLGLIPA